MLKRFLTVIVLRMAAGVHSCYCRTWSRNTLPELYFLSSTGVHVPLDWQQIRGGGVVDLSTFTASPTTDVWGSC